MEKLRLIAQQLDTRLRADSPQIERDEKARQEGLVWRGLRVLSSGALAPFFVALFAAWNLTLVYTIGLVKSEPTWIHGLLVVGVALVEYAFQLTVVLLARLLYVNYGWLCAFARYIQCLFHKEFPLVMIDETAGEAEMPRAYQACVDAQWERLQPTLERYRDRVCISLENDLVGEEVLYRQNKDRLLKRGYKCSDSRSDGYPVRLTVINV